MATLVLALAPVVRVLWARIVPEAPWRAQTAARASTAVAERAQGRPTRQRAYPAAVVGSARSPAPTALQCASSAGRVHTVRGCGSPCAHTAVRGGSAPDAAAPGGFLHAATVRLGPLQCPRAPRAARRAPRVVSVPCLANPSAHPAPRAASPRTTTLVTRRRAIPAADALPADTAQYGARRHRRRVPSVLQAATALSVPQFAPCVHSIVW